MKIPTATYRLQFGRSFGFLSAAALVDYLDRLGISDVYASPVFEAVKGSMHGYDIVNPNHLNPELGHWSDFRELARRLSEKEMGWVQDIVPNHMAYAFANRMLMDVLERGVYSPCRSFFDIDWNHPRNFLKGKLSAPFLGKPYEECLANGEINLSYGVEGFMIKYYNITLPLHLAAYGDLLRLVLNRIQKLKPTDSVYASLCEILNAFENHHSAICWSRSRRGGLRLKKSLWRLYCRSEKIREGMADILALHSGASGDPDGFQRLDRLLDRQMFRLLFFRAAGKVINYRRFFDINGLIALRQENQSVFKHTHRLLSGLIKKGIITGVRVDHIDGLAQPAVYLDRLHRMIGDRYLVVEKILGPDETLPETWPVQGTTGYDFAFMVNGLFVDPTGEAGLTSAHADFTDIRVPLNQILYQAKQQIMDDLFGGEVDGLVEKISTISIKASSSAESPLPHLREALMETLARFPVYRSYLDPVSGKGTKDSHIPEAIEEALSYRPELTAELIFLSGILSYDNGAGPFSKDRNEIIFKFHQLSATLMAKAFEDTALYRYSRLLSLNEVGGDPGRFGVSRDEFGRFIRSRALKWPHSLNATSTHDAKRGEDSRARLNILSEMPGEWALTVNRWHRQNDKHAVYIGSKRVPDKDREYFLYQTMIGVWPFGRDEGPPVDERIRDYLIKAEREAKTYTSWLSPNVDYEEAILSYLSGILHPSEENAFFPDFLAFRGRVAWYGLFNALSQCLVKITAPGVPDFYQGTELWDFHLVDPDNRRPVDFDIRKKMLSLLKSSGNRAKIIDGLLKSPFESGLKLFLIMAALNFRKANQELFQKGDYIGLKTVGEFERHVMAFGRCHEKKWSLTVVPRFVTSLIAEKCYPLGTVWKNTAVELPADAPDSWQNIFTEEVATGGGLLPMSSLLSSFPAALLTNVRSV
jgi:(1->4)-alpha-D-glucan 1-alpha-D-glucosylmutase